MQSARPGGIPATENLQQVIEAAHGSLMSWYRLNRRDLPWRGQHDPYAVWVSEIMLQQTQVATVVPYFERWMERFPTLEALAAAPLEDVLRYWAGLGYYARARNLHRAAQMIAEDYGASVPSDERLGTLPGVGRYTQGAIRSIAFGQSEPIVDANIARVLCRVFGMDGDPKSSTVQAKLWRLASELVPDECPGDFNQALMELGALVCTPADPACDRCPILNVCHAGKCTDPTAWPEIPPGRSTVRVTHASAVVQRDGEYLIARRRPNGLWGGLWEFPRRVCGAGESPVDCSARAALEITGVEVAVKQKIATIKHAVTHYAITLYGFEADAIAGEPQLRDCDAVTWALPDEIEKLPMSAPQSALLRALFEHHAPHTRCETMPSLFA